MTIIVGAGAAGLAVAIFAARRGVPVLLLEGAPRPGAKILVSGGSRCNVTNAVVSERDFRGGPPHLVRRILRAFTAEQTAAFFAQLGVPLHEEEHGKLFPNANRSRAVLEGLLVEVRRLGVDLRAGERVLGVERTGGGLRVTTAKGALEARHVVLATGGCSLPKSGSDGEGLRLAARLGHSVVPATPALVPLVLEGSWHRPLSGVALPAELTLRAQGRPVERASGSLLFTHFGVSGPVVLDISRFWLRARLEDREPVLTASLLPGVRFEECEARLLAAASLSPRLTVAHLLARWLPAAVGEAVSIGAGVAGDVALGSLRREQRRRLLHGLLERKLPVSGSRGWDHAEATAGGVPLDEVDTRSMESRRCQGLFLVGEILDVDGRLGGFNFQWAWSSAWVAAGGMAGQHRGSPRRVGAA